jgi:hypothetical protein
LYLFFSLVFFKMKCYSAIHLCYPIE